MTHNLYETSAEYLSAEIRDRTARSLAIRVINLILTKLKF
jgi:hypothetical protein